ncbi:Uncharacterised protein [Streptococcus pneumoniae]|nr:hypothetical protein B4087_5701 [Bacillus cereus]CKF49714.1 Uncharacterised protein [Streptococcus pneumoniae]CKF89737.1 Uncharacterised protein [Streptococcus pneumoniae]CKG17572.1 Uncharacterised protein [Streptococcus pneumoniae]
MKRKIDENNKDAIMASLKRKIKKLEEEKKQLREQLKVAMQKFIERFEGIKFPPLPLTKQNRIITNPSKPKKELLIGSFLRQYFLIQYF